MIHGRRSRSSARSQLLSQERPIPTKAILVGLPKSIEEKLTRQTVSADLELVACDTADVERISSLMSAENANVVVIDSSQIWAAGLARGLRVHKQDTRVLILANASQLTGYIIYDYDRGIENAGELEVLRAIESAAHHRPFSNSP